MMQSYAWRCGAAPQWLVFEQYSTLLDVNRYMNMCVYIAM